MQFLRTAFWVVIFVVLALFAKANWYIPPTSSGYVPIKLWEDWILLVRLPVLILAAFLFGLVPMWAVSRIGRWRHRRPVERTEPLPATPVSEPRVVASPADEPYPATDAGVASDPAPPERPPFRP